MEKFEKFSLVWSNSSSSEILVVLTDPIEIPFFEDGQGSSSGCTIPFDPTNPKEWSRTFSAQIAWNLSANNYAIINPRNYELVEPIVENGYIPYDQATGQIRNLLGLFSVASKFYGESEKETLNDIVEGLSKFLKRGSE